MSKRVKLYRMESREGMKQVYSQTWHSFVSSAVEVFSDEEVFFSVFEER